MPAALRAPRCARVPSSTPALFPSTEPGARCPWVLHRISGSAEFTVEAWVRRDGPGETAGTGVGGLSLVPIAGKGRGEKDGSNLDCNYAFGFWGDVLGADFEDMASGANHPVQGQTKVSWGVWHHVAASFDGSTWRLFLDGKLDASKATSATPRYDSIQHFGIGTALNSAGTAAGHLHGAVDEVRVWDHARSETEIAGAMFETVSQGNGLVSRWALDAADQTAVDSVGKNPGTIVGATFVKPGAVLDHGAPPVLEAPAPSDDASVPAQGASLSLSLNDPDGDELSVTFHLRELSTMDDFTIVVLPDTQYYTVEGKGREHIFYDQTKWIMDNFDGYDIAGVVHNGDIVDKADLTYQWTIADKAMSELESPVAGFPDGMPFGVAVGNHDQSPNGSANGTQNFNKYFGVSRFAGRSYYGGHYGDDNDESWYTFSAGGLDFVVVNLQYDTAPGSAVLSWARSIFEQHPESFGILNSHYIVGSSGSFGAQGKAIYEALKDVDNLQLMTSGHVSAEARRTDTFQGNVIHSMLADYQGRANGGNGWMRIWELAPASNELTVRTYSPTLDKFETDDDSEFTLPVDLHGAGGPFQVAGSVDHAAVSASVQLDVKPGRTYEWYATVTDCAHSVDSPLYRFTTNP